MATMKLRGLIGGTDPRILIIGGLALLAVVFSLYKAVSSLSGSETSPDYRRSPPSAFALPVVDTIVDPQLLTEPRLPDAAYEQIEAKTQQLSEMIAKGKMSAPYLVRQGMTAVKADAIARQLSSYERIYAGRSTQVDDYVDLGSVGPSAAETSQTIEFGAGAGGAPGGSFSVTYNFATSGDPLDWSLAGIDLQF